MTREDVDRITQAVVYLAECVYIPYTAAIEPTAPPEDKDHIRARLHGLHEIGAVKLWASEDRMRPLDGEEPLTSRPADVTITREDYSGLYEQMMARLVENREHFRGPESFDGISEVVEGKHTLFLFGLKDHLQTNGILLDQRGAGNVQRYFKGLVGQLLVAEDVVQQVAVRLHLPDAATLDIDQIESARRHIPPFRDRLLRSMGNEELLFDERDAMVERLTSLIVDEFFDYMWEVRQDQRRSGPEKARAWSFLQLVLPPILSRRNASRFFGWSGSKPTAPEMILVELQRMSRDRRSKGT
jgi:hypothetical protein